MIYPVYSIVTLYQYKISSKLSIDSGGCIPDILCMVILTLLSHSHLSHGH